MALVVEDGTGTVAGANSYVSVNDAKTFATKRGKTFAANDTAIEAFLVNAMDWLDTRPNLKGSKLLTTQPLQWPRKDVYIDDPCVPYTAPGALPPQLIAAQIQLAIEQDAGIDLMPSASGPTVVREKVDVIETEYSEKYNMILPALSRVDAFLAPLLNVGIALRTVRV